MSYQYYLIEDKKHKMEKAYKVDREHVENARNYRLQKMSDIDIYILYES